MLRLNNPKRYNNLIKLQEQYNESQIVISHQKYRKESFIYNKEITTSINPAFFITLKYIDKIASSPERVESMFANIKYALTEGKGKDYRFIHHSERGLSGSYHSHIFVSSIKNKSKQKQIEWFIEQLNDFKKLSKYSIATANDSIDVRLFDNKELNLSPTLRTNYVEKTDTRQYNSLDIFNTDNPYDSY